MTYVDHISNFLDSMERNDLLEIVEKGISSGCVGEEGHRSGARPRNDGSEEDTDQNSAPNAIEHEENGQEPERT